MSVSSWDPLASTHELSPELVGATLKRQIQNILKSYTGWYDLLSELIQNALDAVEARRKNEPGVEPRIYVTIDIKNNRISVTDNGTGLTEDRLKTFLAPNVSYKDISNRGNKGVGITFVGYGFNELQISTKCGEYQFVGMLSNGRNWVEDRIGVISRPHVVAGGTTIDTNFEKIDQGSSFTLTLKGENIRPRNLTWVSASSAEQWAKVLRVKTPLGGIYIDNDPQPVKCEVIVFDGSGNKSTVTLAECTYLYPHKEIGASQALSDIKREQLSLISSGKDPSRLPERFYSLNGLFEYWRINNLLDTDNSIFAKTLDENDRTLIERYSVCCYGYFCYSTDIWDAYNDNKLGLRRGTRLLRGGIQLAANGMPQGELLVIPLKRNIGYQNVAHIVVHFRAADPDLGRKGFQPELENLAEKLSVVAVNSFLDRRAHLKQETGAPPDIAANAEIQQWIKEQLAHEEKNPLVITRKDVFLPMMEPSLTSTPLNEQDVISLFNQLLAGGVIRGIKVMSTSQHNQYDGVFKFLLQPPVGNHIYDKQKNPLGINQENTTKPFTSAPEILEYKYNLDALIHDLEKEEKIEKDIRLVVVWDVGDAWSTRYRLVSLLDEANVHLRRIHGVTHLARPSIGTSVVFYLIALKELIGYINNPDECQAYHRKQYGSS